MFCWLSKWFARRKKSTFAVERSRRFIDSGTANGVSIAAALGSGGGPKEGRLGAAAGVGSSARTIAKVREVSVILRRLHGPPPSAAARPPGRPGFDLLYDRRDD